eukprot:7325509-Pyramimonas_sp.AAC.1
MATKCLDLLVYSVSALATPTVASSGSASGAPRIQSNFYRGVAVVLTASDTEVVREKNGEAVQVATIGN